MKKLVSKSDEVTEGKNLGEEISEVVLGWHMHGCAYGLVTKDLDPFLSTIDVLELGALSRCVCEDASGLIVQLESEWKWEFHSHLFHRIRYRHDVHSSIAGGGYLDGST